MTSVDEDNLDRLVAERKNFLASLTSASRGKHDIVDELSCSRSTVDRVLNDLSAAQLVEHADGEWEATYVGECMCRQYEKYIECLRDIADAVPILDALPNGTTLADEFVVGSTVHEPSPVVPDSHLGPLFAVIRDATRIQGVVPKAILGVADRFAQSVTAGDSYELELVLSTDVIEQLRELELEGLHDAMRDPNMSLYRDSFSQSFGFWIADGTEVVVVIYTETGIAGILINGTDDAIDRATTMYNSIRDDAELVTETR